MNAVATTTIAVLRGTSTDGYGDVVDGSTAILSGVPASILEQRRTVATEADPTPRAVITYTGRVSAGTDIADGDRIRDERTSAVYIVDSAHLVASPAMTNDLRLDLRRVA